MAKLNDLTGKTIGNWEVLYRNGSTPNKASVWHCRCLLCGAEKDAAGYSLTSGKSTKCRSCVPKETLTKGHRKEPVYNTYNAMKQRCYNPNHKSYHNYGGRGIGMCDEWKDNPDAFISWAFSSGYQPGLTLDRIDCDGDYAPDNCRWATAQEQSENKRNVRLITFNGKQFPANTALRMSGISRTTFRRYTVEKGMEPQEAFDMLLSRY